MTDTGLLHAIDFGTSTSAIVVCQPDGTLTPVRDPAQQAGPRSVRTSVCVLPDGRIVVGREAENAKKLYPDAYRSEFKRDFGDPTATMPGNRRMTPDELAVEVVRFLRECAQEAVAGEPDRVVVTVPASWEAGNKKLMRLVVRRAGYHDADVDLVAEPVAAVAYAFNGHPSPAGRVTVLVYDLGGGTFDCALARGDSGWYEVLGDPGGKDDIGGAAFDDLLLGLVSRRFGDAVPPPLGSTDDPDVMRRWLSLKDTCEEIKWRLSADEHAEELLTELTPRGTFELTRADFEKEIRPLVADTLSICDHLLKHQLGMDWPDVDRIVPVGGGSQIPLVRKMLAQRAGRPVLRVDHPDMAVVMGAAVVGRDTNAAAKARRLFVNGEKKIVHEPELGFGKLVELAYGRPSAGSYVTFTVTYAHGPHANPTGSLVDGQSVRVDSGMVINVAATDRS